MPDVDDSVVAQSSARIGTVLHGKYHLHRILGIGGMATVYVATHRNGKEFAVKVLHPEISTNKELRSRFVREGYLANSVKHTGAVAVIDDDVAEDGAAFLVMELLHGQNVDVLTERMGGRLPLMLVTGIGLQVLDVLAAAHASGLVHRDIKPANLLLTGDGRVKVLDFGIARIRDAATKQFTDVGCVMGTPAYMAPEQAMANAEEIDAQSDLWAVGATLFTLASGQLVHDADNAQQILIKAATAPARPLATVAPTVPPQLCEIVDRALAFKKSDRWANAVAMREALRAASLALFAAVPTPEKLAELVEEAQEGATGVSVPTGEHLLPARPGTTTAPSRSKLAGALTTENGVSTESLLSRGANARSPRTVIAAATIGSVLGIALVLALLRGSASSAGPAVGVSSPIPPSTTSIPNVSVPSVASTGLTTIPTVPSPPAPLTAPAVPVDQLPVARMPPASGPRPKPSAPAVESIAPPAVGAPAKANCNPPYDVDAKGNKRWKRDCL